MFITVEGSVHVWTVGLELKIYGKGWFSLDPRDLFTDKYRDLEYKTVFVLFLFFNNLIRSLIYNTLHDIILYLLYNSLSGWKQYHQSRSERLIQSKFDSESLPFPLRYVSYTSSLNPYSLSFNFLGLQFSQIERVSTLLS